ncbi:uncharacterized protein LOC125295725 isoform X1 [Alosa alosa]|uniref:uncharacterized protein LOC125295725 isoform X1 n=1 Tax=Alosa alosa TaxID=278164 RepID=UPI0020154E40|nr:uncharacterized protein LOC125295725 isoform X1 [Alosa alosa]
MLPLPLETMKSHKKSRGQALGQESNNTYCKAVTKTGNRLSLQTHTHSQLVGSPQFGSGLLNNPLVFAPTGAAVLQLAQIEAQLALNQLSALSISSQHSNNPVALLGLLRAAAASACPSAVSMYRQPQGADFARPRHLMPVAVNQDNHSISQDYQRSAFPPAIPEDLEVAKYQRINTGFRQNAPAVQDMCFPPRPTQNLGKPGGEDWAQYKAPSSQHASSTVMDQSGSSSWNTSRSAGEKSTSDSVGNLLASFGLSSKDLELLSRYPDSQLTPESLPLILQDLKGRKAGRNAPVSPPHSQLSMLPPHHSPKPDPTPGTAAHVPSYLSMATQVPGKVIEYGHASQESFKRVPLPPSPTKHKPEATVNTQEARNYLQHHRKPSPGLRSHTRTSRSPPSVKGPTPTMVNDYMAAQPRVYPHTCSLCVVQCEDAKDWHNHINTVVHTAGCKDLRNQYPDWRPPGSSLWPSRDRSPSPDGWSGRHGNRSASRSASRSLSSCSSPGHSPTRHGHSSRGAASRGQRWRSPDRQTPYRHAHSHSPPSHHQHHHLPQHQHQHAPPHRGRHGSPYSRRSHPCHSSGHIPTDGASARHLPHDRPRGPHEVSRRRAAAGPPSSSSPCSSLSSSSSSRNNKRQPSTSPGGDKAKVPERRRASRSSSTQGKSPASTSKSSSTKIDHPPMSPASKSDPKVAASDPKPIVEPVESKKADTVFRQTETTEKVKWTTDERGIVLMSGLPDSGYTESDIVKLVTPYGDPTQVIIATAEGKAVVVLPDKSSAQEMVNAPACICDCQLILEQLSVSVDLSRPVTLFHVMMGPDKPCGALTAWNRLLVVKNVPDTPNGPREVQQLIQRFGNVCRSLVLNHNKIIFEMETAAIAQVVYKRFQKFPCIVQNNPLSFSMKPDVMLVKKNEEAKSNPSTSTSSDCKASDPAASSDPSPAAAGGQEALSSEAIAAEQTDSATTEADAGKLPDSCPAGKDTSTSQVPVAVAVNGDGEIAAKGGGGGSDVEAVGEKLDLPKFTPALLQALLQECKSRSALRASAEPKGADTEAAPGSHAPPETTAPRDIGVTRDEDQEMGGDLEDDLVPCVMDDFVTVDEVGDFAGEPSQPLEEALAVTAEGVSAEGSLHSETASLVPENTGADTREEDERVESTAPGGRINQNLMEENVEDHTQQNVESESCTGSIAVGNQQGEKEKEEVITPGPISSQAETGSSSDCTDPLEEDGPHRVVQMDSCATMDAVVTTGEKEEESDYKTQDETSITTSPTLELRVISEGPKRRRSPDQPEVVTKRIRKEPIFAKDYSLPPFGSDRPVGMEFLEPRTGFFCQVCAKFFCGDEEAKESHCRGVEHYENLETALQHWRLKLSSGPNGASL